jgi:hypothetical protein
MLVARKDIQVYDFNSKDNSVGTVTGYVGVLISLWLLLFAGQRKECFLDRLKKLEQRNHKCVELRGGICKCIFFNPVACCFDYKAKRLISTLVLAGRTRFDSRQRQNSFLLHNV